VGCSSRSGSLGDLGSSRRSRRPRVAVAAGREEERGLKFENNELVVGDVVALLVFALWKQVRARRVEASVVWGTVAAK